jgi:hypothetical protein
MRSIRGFVAAATTAGLFGLLIVPSASAAQGATGTEKGSWTLRGFGAGLDTDEFRFESGSPIGPFPFLPIVDVSFTLGDGSGAAVALEYRATRRTARASTCQWAASGGCV